MCIPARPAAAAARSEVWAVRGADEDPEVGTSIDATSYYELEAEEYARKGVTLTPELWLVKLMVGAIDSSCGPSKT